MKSNAILTIFKKELARFFKDRRTLIALLMPGFLIYIIYSLMGGAMSDAFMPDEDYDPIIYVENAPASAIALFELAELDYLDSENAQDEMNRIKNGVSDL